MNKVKEEQALMASAVTEDNDQTLQNLNNLGLLSKFQTLPHEAFLPPTQRDQYLAMFFFHTELKLNTNNKLDEKSLNDKAMAFGFAYSNKIERYIKPRLDCLAKPYWPISDEELSRWTTAAKYELEKQAKDRVCQELTQFLQKEIIGLQKIAESQAKKFKTDDNTHFVYDKKQNFFTSERQKNIADSINYLIKRRKNLSNTDDDYIKRSHSEALSSLTSIWHADMYKKATNASEIYFKAVLKKVNSFGFVVKEQCLSLAQLEGENEAHYMPKGLKSGWREAGWFGAADELTFEQVTALYAGVGGDKLDPKVSEQARIQSLLTQKSQYSVQWAYYPTKALLALIDRTLKKDLNALKGLLGERGVTMPDYFKKILWVKKVALARIEFLKQKAQTTAKEAAANVLYLSQFHTPLPSYTLLWNEDKWQTQPKKLGKFINKAGLADVQPVECFLLSEEGKACYLRGPWWYMPKPSSGASDPMSVLALKHVKVITTQVPAPNGNGPQGGATTFAGLMEEVKKGSEATLGMSIAQVMFKHEGALWQDQYHYESGMGQDGNSGYIANAQAQFLRYTSETTANVGVPADKISDLSDLSVDKAFSTGAEVKLGLNLLSAQLSFEAWLPLATVNNGLAKEKDPQKAKVTGYPLVLDYVTQTNEAQQYYAGDMCMKISASVYGMAAASVKLSGAIEVGPSSDNDEIGVKGRAYKVNDPNISQRNILEGGSVLQGAGQVGIGVNAFVGVEAGGSLKGEVFWRPPSSHKVASTAVKQQMSANTNTLASLGSITAQASASLGYGGDLAIKLIYDKGKLVLVTAAKLVCGHGVGGKIAVALNPYNIDAFIGSLLNLLNNSNFKYLHLLGDERGDEKGNKGSDGDTFEQLNQGLTLAVSLGLSYADVMLLPFEVLADYKKTVMEEEYAPVIAKNIIDRDSLQVTKAWIQNLPPETLAPLLTCLINAQEYTLAESMSISWESLKNMTPLSTKEANKPSYQTDHDNKAQLEAVLQILAWISPVKSSDEKQKQNKCSQFEKTLYRMGRNTGAYGVNYQDKWQRFMVNWLQLAEFVKLHAGNNINLKEQVIFEFNNAMESLCQNMRAFSYQQLSHQRNDGTAFKTNKTCFLAYYAGPALTEEQKTEVDMVKQKIKQHQAQPYMFEI
ncbi:hypothetical protein [uncultured Shewanella sp.]|uniref:hypothetical protein n=1 Tax=uncultured Shewanella sp. TaxID=173975 RepID=UPI002604AFFC|nr:hypothetical protein [uncultured Shewanella sp.]